MARKKKHIIQDIILISISVAAAVALSKSGIISSFIADFRELEHLGSFLAGMMFTSVFTTAPAIVVLGELARDNSVLMTALVGGAGAAIGDYFIFRFIKDRVSEDIKYVLRHSKTERIPAIFRTRLFHRLVPLLGGIVIASPLPDEIGIAMLGLSKTKDRIFIPVSFIFNSLGILIIGLIARAI